MRKNITLILLICFILSTLAFGILWVKERNSQAAALLIARSSANDAYNSFKMYKNTGDESYYCYGVSAFRSFQQAYYLLVENTNKSTNYVFCNQIYGSLVLFPDRSQEHITELLQITELLSNNAKDENAYILMSNLRNVI